MSRRTRPRAATLPQEPQKASPLPSEPSERLLAAGWLHESDPRLGPWCWRQPETRALFRERDALDLLRSTLKK